MGFEIHLRCDRNPDHKIFIDYLPMSSHLTLADWDYNLIPEAKTGYGWAIAPDGWVCPECQRDELEENAILRDQQRSYADYAAGGSR